VSAFTPTFKTAGRNEILMLRALSMEADGFLTFPNGITNHWEGSLMKVSSSVALAASSVLALGSIGPNTGVSIGKPIDANGTATASDPDSVNLKVQALYLKKAVPPTGPFGNIAPVGIITQLTLTNQFPLQEAFSKPGTYDSYYRPTHPGNATTGGAYGSISRARSMPGSTVFHARVTRPHARSSLKVPESPFRRLTGGRPVKGDRPMLRHGGRYKAEERINRSK
jgi:hypothetical protein